MVSDTTSGRYPVISVKLRREPLPFELWRVSSIWLLKKF
jgi:hypothetical protein